MLRTIFFENYLSASLQGIEFQQVKSVFISPNILRLYDRVLAGQFPLLLTLFFGIAVSENDPKLKI